MSKIFIAPGQRTPFVKAGGEFSSLSSIDLTIPVMKAAIQIAQPDYVIWGQVIPSPTISNLSREALLEAGLNPEIPGSTSVLACSTSMLAAIQAYGMLGTGGLDLALVGGVESMSNVPIALKAEASQRLMMTFRSNPAEAQGLLSSFGPSDFELPIRGWANRISGRSMGEHTEDTAKAFAIEREGQDKIAELSHANALKARKTGFFDDLIIPVNGVTEDAIPRVDSTAEALAALKPVFDRSETGTLTAGNSSPLTDGAAGLWVANEAGLERLGQAPVIEVVDWQLAAMDYQEEGILMAPARAIPKLLARHKLKFEDIQLWEIHEAFGAQVLANISAISDPKYRQEKAGVDFDFGDFPMDRLNPHGGSLALGHPFGATGARILSQAAKQLASQTSGSYAVVSVCADGGQGSVMLLKRCWRHCT